MTIALDKVAAELAEQAWREFSAGYAWNTQDIMIPLTKAIKQAMRAAYEDAAKTCEELPAGMNMLGGLAVECAKAIRLRAGTEG